mmetsp:Transcript_27952/g.54458  ORF Transcript_27952/g.54458 Transcript_27952/m.54458 type:complete len:497 (-) Transcript_27952:456-1946(-)
MESAAEAKAVAAAAGEEIPESDVKEKKEAPSSGQKRAREEDAEEANTKEAKQKTARPTVVLKVVEEAKPEPQEVIEASVTALQRLPNGEVTQALLCPAYLVGRVIGRQGATIKWLEAKTGTKLHIDQNFPPGQPRKVNVTGPNVEVVQEAIKMASEIMHNGPPKEENFSEVISKAAPYGSGSAPRDTYKEYKPPASTTLPEKKGIDPRVAKALAQIQAATGADGKVKGSGPEMSDTFDCPQHLVGRVIGRGGETVRELQNKTGCTVSIDQNFPHGVPRKITVSGPSSLIAAAKNMIHNVMEMGPVALGDGIRRPPPSTSSYSGGAPKSFGGNADRIVKCEPHLVGKIIGRRGETVNELQARTGCKISIDQSMPQGEPRNIQLFGTEDQCDKAQDLIRKIMANPFQSLGSLINGGGSSSASNYRGSSASSNHAYGGGYGNYGAAAAGYNQYYGHGGGYTGGYGYGYGGSQGYGGHGNWQQWQQHGASTDGDQSHGQR